MTESKDAGQELREAAAAMQDLLYGQMAVNYYPEWVAKLPVVQRLHKAVEAVLTHPEAQGNKDLGEPQTSFAWQKIESAPDDCSQVLVCRYEPGYRCEYVLSPVTAKLFLEPGAPAVWQFYFNSNPIPANFAPTHWAPLPPPPSERSEAAPTLLIKGESELESASNGMGLR